MRLGVVMTGVGAHAAANLGVLRALEERGIALHCVCGLHGGAWPAALFAMGRCAKERETALSQAARMGRRMLMPASPSKALIARGTQALSSGRRLENLLLAQTGHRLLSLCERPVVFPCRMLRTGHRVVFSTRAYAQENGAILSMQASVSFAARAAMALPPVLAPMEFMGSALLCDSDAAFACRQMAALGAHRILVIAPHGSAKRKPDALDLAGTALGDLGLSAQEAHTGVLEIASPQSVGAMDFEKMALCAQEGYRAAQAELDRIFERMGMAFCRVLPFERRVTWRQR